MRLYLWDNLLLSTAFSSPAENRQKEDYEKLLYII